MSLYLFWCLIKGPCAKIPDICGENGKCKDDGCAASLKCDCVNGFTGKLCKSGKLYSNIISLRS